MSSRLRSFAASQATAACDHSVREVTLGVSAGNYCTLQVIVYWTNAYQRRHFCEKSSIVFAPFQRYRQAW